MKTTATKLTDSQVSALRAASVHGFVVVSPPSQRGLRDDRPNLCACNTFSALAKRGLLTHYVNGTPEPEFFSCVGGTEGYLTPAGRAAL